MSDLVHGTLGISGTGLPTQWLERGLLQPSGLATATLQTGGGGRNFSWKKTLIGGAIGGGVGVAWGGGHRERGDGLHRRCKGPYWFRSGCNGGLTLLTPIKLKGTERVS